MSKANVDTDSLADSGVGAWQPITIIKFSLVSHFSLFVTLSERHLFHWLDVAAPRSGLSQLQLRWHRRIARFQEVHETLLQAL